MKFGIHYLLSCSNDQLLAQRYQDTIEQAVYAESLGFESVWPVEQHFNQEQSALSCPTLLLANIAARTKSLRLGTAIVQLGLNHPLRVAEEIATLDVLSGGRVEFGVGRGSNPSHFAGFNVDLSESRARMEESLDYIKAAFSSDRFSFQGQFFKGEDICLVPKPLQSPHPPVMVAANSAETAKFAGQAGYAIVIALHINPLPKAKELVALYRKELTEAGHLQHFPVTLLLPLFVAEREDEVKQAVEPAVERFVRLITSLLSSQASGWTNQTEQQSMQLLLERLNQTTYQSMNKVMAVFGTPDVCVERLRQIEEEMGVGRFICWFNMVGAISPPQVRSSMELFSERVMPHFA